MALDIVEESNGCFYVWGTMTDGSSVLVRVEDFQPYLYVAMPLTEVRISFSSHGDVYP